jgi:hypothetical protein
MEAIIKNSNGSVDVSYRRNTLANPVTVNPDRNIKTEKCCLQSSTDTWPSG